MSGIMQLLLSGRPQVASDPYFEYTTLLLPGNGTNGAQNNTFLDSSTNAFSITRNGNTTQGTFSPFSQTGWGNYFDGTGDYLDAGSNSAFSFGTGAYTVEAWVFVTARSSSGSQIFANDTTGGFAFEDDNSLGLLLYSRGTANILSAGSSNRLPLNSWAHVAIVRSGTGSNQTAIYLNGTQVALGTDSTNWTVTGPAKIGSISTAGYDLNGYISNFRVVKGTAVYTSNFTPPTTPLTAITNTSLLTCQSNRFIDNSSNNFTITRNGDVSVQAFSPFNPTAAWSAATNGGSGYFDGSGDYLSVADNAAFDFGSGNFTIELWAYMTGAAQQFFLGQWNSPNRSWVFLLKNSGTTLSFTYSTTGSNELNVDASITAQPNRWAHFAVVRNGDTLKTYMNGVEIGSGSFTGVTLYNASQAIEIGRNPEATSTWNYTGYMSDVRIVKGTAVYTSAFTPPTAPLTAITNTSLLCNFTNAGIYDATSKNDLETVGNAQISTTQSKFGGSSISFDGSGDYLDAPSNLGFTFGTGDFTVEFWLNTSSTGFNIINPSTATGSGYWALLVQSSNLRWNNAYNVTNLWEISASAILNGAWHHVAIARASGSTKVFYDGVLQTTQSDTTNYSGVAAWRIGSGNIAGLNGYIQDLRITKGYARYTTNFTAPTAAFPLL